MSPIFVTSKQINDYFLIYFHQARDSTLLMILNDSQNDQRYLGQEKNGQNQSTLRLSRPNVKRVLWRTQTLKECMLTIQFNSINIKDY